MSRRIGLFCCVLIVLGILLCTLVGESGMNELHAASPSTRAGDQNPAIASAATSTGGHLKPLAPRDLASALADVEPAVLLVFGTLLLAVATAIKTVRSRKSES